MGPEPSIDALSATLDVVYRNESQRMLARLICLLHNFDPVEEALHDGFRAAGPDADWGIWLFHGSQEQYHRSFATLPVAEQRNRRNDDGEAVSGPVHAA